MLCRFWVCDSAHLLSSIRVNACPYIISSPNDPTSIITLKNHIVAASAYLYRDANNISICVYVSLLSTRHRSVMADDDDHNRDDIVADGHDIDTTDKPTRRSRDSFVRRLANAFEEFAQTRQSSHLHQMSDGLYRSLQTLDTSSVVDEESDDGTDGEIDDESEHKSVASSADNMSLDTDRVLNYDTLPEISTAHLDDEKHLINMEVHFPRRESVLNNITERDNFTISPDRSVSPSLSSDSYRPDLQQIPDTERVDVEDDSATDCDQTSAIR